jgi:AcrR family transcriptional regulator
MSSVREQHKIRTKKCILDSAVKLFSKNGFEKTSIEALAKEAGIGKGTVYSYFRTKRDIVKAFCDDQLEYTRSELALKTNPDTPLIEQLLIIFMADFKYVTENKEFGRVYLHEKIFPKKPLTEKDFQVQNDYFDMLYPIYQRAQERGELRKDIELLHISGHFYAIYLLMLSCWYTGMIPTEEIGEATKVLLTQAIEGLKP